MTGHWPEPLVDNDTYQIIDDAISELAHRRGLWMSDPNIIHLLASLIAQAERCLPETVTVARDECDWDDIAQLLGTNPTEAQLRFDPDSPVADKRWPFARTDRQTSTNPKRRPPPNAHPRRQNLRKEPPRPNPTTQPRHQPATDSIRP